MEFGFEDDQSHKPKKSALRLVKPAPPPVDEVPPFTDVDVPPFESPVEPGFELPPFLAPVWPDPHEPDPELPFLTPEECLCKSEPVTAADIQWSL